MTGTLPAISPFSESIMRPDTGQEEQQCINNEKNNRVRYSSSVLRTLNSSFHRWVSSRETAHNSSVPTSVK